MNFYKMTTQAVAPKTATAELYVLLRNDSLESYKIEHGERIAQMMLEKILNYELLEIDARPAILDTRDGGMGSTGKK